MSSIIGSVGGTFLTNAVLFGTGVALAGATAVGVVQTQQSAGTEPVPPSEVASYSAGD